MLTNAQMEERAVVGLKTWFCRTHHTDCHRQRCLSYDQKWGVTDIIYHCLRCRRWWAEWSPTINGLNRCMSQAFSRTIYNSLWRKDPVFKMMVERG